MNIECRSKDKKTSKFDIGYSTFDILLFLRFLFQPEDSCAGGTLVRYGQGYTGRLWGVVKAVFWTGAAIIAGFYIAQL